MFDPRNQTPNDHIPILDPVTTSDYTYNTYEPSNFPTKTPQYLRNRPKSDVGLEGVQFRVQEMLQHDHNGVDESGVSSPPLWKNNQNPTNFRSLSQASRTLAIAQGQWELMEMVKNMPESSYELSLKDLVEKNNALLEPDHQEECLINKDEEIFQEKVKKTIQRQESSSKNKKGGKMIRNESFEDRKVFLKMFFPISLESSNKKKKVKSLQKTTSTRVSPRPEVSENNSKDWWKRKFYGTSESDSSKTESSNSESTDRSGSSGSTSSSNSSRKEKNRKKKGFFSSCWSRLCFSKSKSAD